ncbi:serine/threonine protein phosphatase [Mycolicibacterium elephantis]
MWPHDEFFHAWWVEPGKLLAGEYPGAPRREKATAKIRLLIEAGVGSIVDLTTPQDGLVPYLDVLRDATDEAGWQIRCFSHPIPDNGVIDHAGYDAILTRIQSEIDAGSVVYLHCWGGKGRTSTVVGCRLIDSGLDYEAAIARITELRAGTRKACDPCPETTNQHRLLKERADRRRYPSRATSTRRPR